MKEKKGDKELIVSEYLKGGVSLRDLARKHGMDHGTLHRWVKEFREKGGGRQVAKDTEIVRLRKELDDARLKNELLNAMIDIAEERMGIEIRKKHGARR